MSRCSKCGYSIPDGKTVCPACGAAVSSGTQSKPASNAKTAGGAPAADSRENPMLKYMDSMDNKTLYNFAIASLNGLGVTKDAYAAFRAFKLLAERNDPDGMYKLAEMYEHMDPPESDMALMWLKRAAERNHEPSKLKLQNMAAMGLLSGAASPSGIKVAGGNADGADTGSASGEASGASIFERNVGGVLELTYTGNGVSWSASGYIISDDGYAITNTHAVTTDDGTPVERLHAKVCGQKVGATVVAIGDDKGGHGRGVDLALIKLDKMPQGSVALGFADYDKVRTGDTIYVIGNSLGYGTCITSGIISDKERNLGGHMHMMYDCATNGGNSGGPVLNTEGLVIATHVAGQNSDKGKAQGMNYGIPEPDILNFLQRCSLGVNVQKATIKAPMGEKIKF